ncbi:MAG: MBL fold metallo-hydrolase [Paracoccaceae bacterium]
MAERSYGRAVELAEDVRRVTCRNPSAMTSHGTESYLIGPRRGPVAVVDPGPDDPAHREALMSEIGGAAVTAILVTHSHRDHSLGVPALRALTGAEVLGFGAHGTGMSETMQRLAAASALGGGEGADTSFRPDRRLSDGAAVPVGEIRVTALHTPGHLSNHLCFALEGRGIVFTGDTVMGWSTTLVSPPEGDMAAFMGSLRRLAGRADRMFLPGHGDPVTEPARLLARQIAHREARAEQVRTVLAERPAAPRALTAQIYRDVDPKLWPAAERNVLATLLWLMETGEVAPEGALAAEVPFRLVSQFGAVSD